MTRVLRRAVAVIGAGYGDEGKGLMTDAVAAALGGTPTVVRANGGAQAGHTVIAPDAVVSGPARGTRRRHVFHHVGSGALAGAPTFLSRYFAANPILLASELEELAALGVRPRIAIDPAAPVTTPYDMMLNQIVEEARAGERHGSCGLGFGETVERCLLPRFSLCVADLEDGRGLRARLSRIRDEWVSERLGVLLPEGRRISGEQRELLASEAIFERWLEDAAAFLEAVEPRDAQAVAGDARALVFEGAQGLGLDQERGAFPFVTRSNTGLKNVLALAAEMGVGHLDAVYVTRAYATRHGAGPLEHELPRPPGGVIDETNAPNPWQGVLRFGVLDLAALSRRIARDYADAADAPFPVRRLLAVTCLDQVSDGVRCVADGREQSLSPLSLARKAADAVNAASLVTSAGGRRDDVGGLGFLDE